MGDAMHDIIAVHHVISRQLPVEFPVSSSRPQKGRRAPHASRTSGRTGEAVTALSKWPVSRKIQDYLLTSPKQYQQDIFTELRAEDELVILARGLGLLHLITNFLHFHDAAGNNLVLVVGADDRENEWIGEGMPVAVWPACTDTHILVQ